MNAIFTVVLLISSVILCVSSPTDFLPALLDGGMNAAKTALTLFCIYAVWMGLSAVAEESGITRKAARLLSPACTKFFRTDDSDAVESIAMNVSCNLIGIGGAATPFAVKAIERLEQSGNEFAQNLLFIVNATSIQLIPTTVITLRAAAGSAFAYDIALPSLIATIVSTGSAVAIYFLIDKLKRAKKKKREKRKCAT